MTKNIPIFQNLRRLPWRHSFHVVWLDTKVFRITPEMDLLIEAYTRRQKMLPMTWLIIIIITVVIIILSKYKLWFRSLTMSPALCWEQNRHLYIHSSQQPDEGGTGMTILQTAKLKLSACSWPHNNAHLKVGEKGPWSGKEKAAPSDAFILLWKVPSLGACLLSSPGGSFASESEAHEHGRIQAELDILVS